VLVATELSPRQGRGVALLACSRTARAADHREEAAAARAVREQASRATPLP